MVVDSVGPMSMLFDKRVAVYRLRDPILKAVALRVKTSSKDRKDADPSERIV
jgi:hypothetical protein